MGDSSKIQSIADAALHVHSGAVEIVKVLVPPVASMIGRVASASEHFAGAGPVVIEDSWQPKSIAAVTGRAARNHGQRSCFCMCSSRGDAWSGAPGLLSHARSKEHSRACAERIVRNRLFSVNEWATKRTTGCDRLHAEQMAVVPE